MRDTPQDVVDSFEQEDAQTWKSFFTEGFVKYEAGYLTQNVDYDGFGEYAIWVHNPHTSPSDFFTYLHDRLSTQGKERMMQGVCAAVMEMDPNQDRTTEQAFLSITMMGRDLKSPALARALAEKISQDPACVDKSGLWASCIIIGQMMYDPRKPEEQKAAATLFQALAGPVNARMRNFNPKCFQGDLAVVVGIDEPPVPAGPV